MSQLFLSYSTEIKQTCTPQSPEISTVSHAALRSAKITAKFCTKLSEQLSRLFKKMFFVFILRSNI